MERTEWPTKGHLEEIREEGKIPFSPLASASFVAIGVLLSTLLLARLFHRFYLAYQQVLDAPRVDRTLALLSFELAIVPPLAAGVAALGMGLLQTRFFLKFDLGFRMDRLSGLHRFHPARLAGAVLTGLALGLCSLVAGLGIFVLLARSSIAWLVLGREAPAGVGWFLLTRFVVVCLPGLVVLALFSWLLSALRFRYTHRMTRAEVEAEYRGGT